MKITLTFNENNPRMMEAYQILLGAGHRKTELVTSLLLKMQTMYPHIMTENITSEEVAWFIRGLDYDLISFGFGESKTAGGGKTPPKAKHQKRSRKTVPERPKLMDPIPEPEQEPETETQGGKQSYSAIPTDEEMALFEKLQSYGL